MNYLDANFVSALCFNIRGQTQAAEKFVRKNSAPFVFSELAELECRRAFTVQTGRTDSENWLRLEAMLSGGLWRREPVLWQPLFQSSRKLIDRFGVHLKAGTLDTLHVAHALHLGCTRFLSFDSDSNARVLAVACRLRVYPDLSTTERTRVPR